VPVLFFIGSHWRACLLALLAIAAGVALFIAGRRSVGQPAAPAVVSESEKLYSEGTTQHAETTATEKTRHAVTVRDRITTHPDGTVTQDHTERRDGSETHSHTETNDQATHVETREIVKRVEVPAPLSAWRVSAMVGIDVHKPPLLNPEGRVVYGGAVEHRIFQLPVTGGAFALSNGTVGGVLTVEF
jgi:hypothetical protein